MATAYNINLSAYNNNKQKEKKTEKQQLIGVYL